jgi:hypothetical protein
MSRLWKTGLLFASSMWATDPPRAPAAQNPVVEISGRIIRVNAWQPAAGMPAMTLDVNGVSTRVVLGSMRYLMEQNFNPKTGAEVQVRGYKLSTAVVAIEVRFDGKTIKLRDENGWPVWRGGGWRRRGPGPE